MREHRNPRQRLAKRETADNRRLKLPAPPPEPKSDEVSHLIYVLRDQLRRTDAFVTSAERELVEAWRPGGDDYSSEDEDGGVQRRRMRVEYLIEAGRLSVREAQYTGDQIDAEWTRRGGAA